MGESFAELFEKSVGQFQFRSGSIVKGIVVEISDNYVLVDAGFKSEAVIPIEQFKSLTGELEVAEGDEVEVSLDVLEDGYGETKLSREKAKRLKAWDELEEMLKANKTIVGFVSGRVKGGFTVELGVLKGFLPGSLVDVRPVRDTSFLEGKDVELKVIKLDQKRNNIVLSRKAVLESESHVERSALLDRIEEGQVVKGTVKNLTDYGAFVDLGGIDGLLHVTDMAWKRIKHPSEVVNVGDEIQVKILQLDREKNRVSLGLKQIAEDPWVGIDRRYPLGTRLWGKVSNITDYGCFVEIEEGVEGLVHISEMDWTNKNINPNKVVKLGDEVEVKVLEVDEQRRRISLGIKQTQENPWMLFAAKHEKGQKISGKIKSITDFGVFIGLEGDIDGLVHLSDLSWEKTGEEAVKEFSKGQKGKDWLSKLSSIIELMAKGWALTNIKPVDNMSWNFVALAIQKNNPVVLKISCDQQLIQDEYKSLKHFDGHGARKVLDINTEYNALLLEQSIPGHLLKLHHPINIADTISIYAEVVKKLVRCH